jgi:hypothetical protein
MSRAEELQRELVQLDALIFGRLKMRREDQVIKQCMDLIGESGINSSGVTGVRSLIDYLVKCKVEGLKERVRNAIEES